MERHFSIRKSSQLRGKQILTEFLKKKIWWSSGGKFLKRSTVIKGLEFFTLPENIHINQCEDFILFFSMCCVAQKYISDDRHGRYFYYQNESSLCHDLFSSLSRWKKICHDHAYVRTISLSCAKSANLSTEDIDSLERLYAINFTWCIQQIAIKIPKSEQARYTAPLLNIVHEGVAIDVIADVLKDQKFFSLLSSTMQINDKKLPTEIKNIAIFSHSMSHGGSERVACLLANMFKKLNYNIVFFVKEMNIDDHYALDKGIELVCLCNDTKRGQRIANLLKYHHIDLCIFNDHWLKQNFYDVFTAQLCCVNTICIEHSMFFFPLYAKLTEIFPLRLAAYKNVQALVTLSRCQAQMWVASGISQSVYIPNPMTYPIEEHTQGSSPTLLFVGRICHIKGIVDALYVLAEVKKSVPDAKLIVLGHYEYAEMKDIVKDKIKTLGLTDAVNMMGRVSNVNEYYKKARVIIIPSILEGWSLSLFEAKSAAVPAVIYSMPYLEGVAESDGCIMVGKNDISEMAKAVIRLLQDDKLWDEFSNRAVRSLDRFSNEIVKGKWKSLFDNIENGCKVIDNNYEVASYSKDDVSLSRVIMDEFNIAIDMYAHSKSTYNIQKYIVEMQRVVDKLLPQGTRRRYICKICAQKIYNFIKNVYHRYKK